jgi:lysophospholipase L1-like esterase
MVPILELGTRLFYDPDDRPQYLIWEVMRINPLFSKQLDPHKAYPYIYNGIKTDLTSFVELTYPDTRNPNKIRYSFKKPENTLRVVVVGDSITEVWPLPNFKNFTDFLQQELLKNFPNKKIEVLPIGVGGYNTWAEMHFFQDHLLDLEADIFLLQYGYNDAEQLLLAEHNAKSVRRPKEFTCPPTDQEEIDLPPSTLWEDAKWPDYHLYTIDCMTPNYENATFWGIKSKLLWYISRLLITDGAFKSSIQREASPELRTALRWFQQHAKEKNFHFSVIVFPVNILKEWSSPKDFIEKILNQEKIPFFSLNETFAKQEEPKQFFQDITHPNAKGHRLAGKAIFRFLKQAGFLDEH